MRGYFLAHSGELREGINGHLIQEANEGRWMLSVLCKRGTNFELFRASILSPAIALGRRSLEILGLSCSQCVNHFY
jgi:hypothetical protein